MADPAEETEPADTDDPQVKQEKEWTEAVKSEIAELAATFATREAEFAQASHDRQLASLREKYNAALKRALEEDDSIPVQAAVQRELVRIREGEPIEPSDPPEMPEQVRKLRGVYRDQVEKLEEELSLALAPILREHLEELNQLEAAKSEAGEYPEEAKVLLGKARKKVETRLKEVRVFLDKRALEREEQASEGGDAEDSTAEMAGIGGLDLAPLLEIALNRPDPEDWDSRPRGRVEVWPRRSHRESESPLPWAEIPSGLGSKVVAIEGTPQVALALKSNGRVAVWGPDPEELSVAIEDVQTVDRVADLAVSELGGRLLVGLLKEDGTAQFHPPFPEPSDDEERVDVEDLVDLAVTSEAAVGLRAEGGVVAWGRLPSSVSEGVSELNDVSKLAVHSSLLVALRSDGTVVRLGKSPNRFFPDVERLRDVAFGTQADFGAVVQMVDGTLATTGSFSKHLEDAFEFSRQNQVVKLVGGYEAFAVRTEAGEWAFFGDRLEEEALAGAARNSADVVLGEEAVLGLRWEGAP